jgi:DNA polymerase-3 subunit beta
MKIRCSQEDLSRAVHTAGRAVSSRTTMPILGNLLLETAKDGVRVAATDLELGIRTQIPAQVERGGMVTLPARLLGEIVNTLPSAPVDLRVEEGTSKAEILCERTSFEILGLPGVDFPRLPDTDVEPVCKVGAEMLRGMIRQTIFAASSDETRPFLTGVYLVAEGGEMRLVASDGGRLALRTARIATDGSMAAIVPSKTMHELVRLLVGRDEEIAIGLVDNQVVVAREELRVVSRVISGQFPNYQQVIPTEFKQKVRVATERLYGAVRRVAITARDSATVVRFGSEGDVLRLQSNTPEVGSAQEEIEVTSEGEPIQAAFNARYLMDALSVIEADAVSLNLTGPLSPAAVRPVGSEDYVYVLAPVRIYG